MRKICFALQIQIVIPGSNFNNKHIVAILELSLVIEVNTVKPQLFGPYNSWNSKENVSLYRNQAIQS